MPRRPSIEASIAVSSPQTNAPAPSLIDNSREKSLAQHALAQQSSLPAALERFVDPRDRQRILGPDIEEPFVGADRLGGDAHPFDNAVGERFEQHAVHECAGIALVAVADDVLFLALGGADSGPFQPGRKARPAPAAEPALLDRRNHLLGRERFQTAAEGREPVVPQVLVQIGRIELAAVFGGQVHLRPEKRADRTVADVDGMPGDRIADLVGQQAIEPARGPVAGPPQNAPRLEVF